MLPRFRKNERFYHLHEQKNFFDGVSIICSWGTFDNNRGGSKIILCQDIIELEHAVKNIRKVRKYRWYQEY